MNRRTFCFALTVSWSARGQNVVEGQPTGGTAAATQVTPEQVDELLRLRWQCEPAGQWTPRLEEFVRGHPWRPFLHTLGISGQERYFDHPEDVFFTMSLTKAPGRAAEVLAQLLASHPPFVAEPFKDEGRPREPYDVPELLRGKGLRSARDLFGVYALWLYHDRYSIARDALEKLRPAVSRRMAEVSDPAFDPAAAGRAGIAVRELNGNIAGLLGFLRLYPDSPEAGAVRGRLRNALERRVNFERANPRVWTPSDLASKSLHTVMLPRWQRITPELGWALTKWTGGLAAERVKLVRESMPGWWLARGDRLSGGENYTSPLHVQRALFAAAALIEKLPAARLREWLDVPWCRADLAWIEKAAWCGLTWK